MSAEPKAQPLARERWLAIVGIGEDGIKGLSDEAKRLVASAEIVFGGKRHLELAAPLINGRAEPWPSPFDSSFAAVRSHAGRAVCVLASGDPFLFGVGATLARSFSPDEMQVVPAPSAFSLAAARLGWALQDVDTVSLHGKALTLIRRYLHRGRRILCLTSDDEAPGRIAGLISSLGFGPSRLTVLEALGGPNERIRSAQADVFALDNINPLNILAIECESTREALVVPLAPGLPDEVFEHDGQITKREIRALTLSALAPRKGELLWDVGAGSGSIGIEWMLADPSLRAIALEANPERAARIRRNAGVLGVPGLAVVEGTAPDALANLERPDAIFVGGGASDPGVLDAAIAALPPAGRLVVNAVTLETEALLIARHAALGGTLTRLSVERAAPVGGMTAWRPALPVTQWSWVKP
ncbi:MAG TPA: precorrin-6y C5,15-methyltransferase (decarboxylating) subunit CbiE [Alphaproteobacteria bacterium]